jgi:hypothetical protein
VKTRDDRNHHHDRHALTALQRPPRGSHASEPSLLHRRTDHNVPRPAGHDDVRVGGPKLAAVTDSWSAAIVVMLEVAVANIMNPR